MLRRLSFALVAAFAILIAPATNAQVMTVTSAAGWPVVEIDPLTGARRSLFTTNFPGSVRFQVSALDQIRRRLFFLGYIGETPELITVDLASQTTTFVPIAGIGIPVFFEYDPIADRVLTLDGSRIVSIDPRTGAVELLMTVNFSGGIRFEVSSFDVAGRRLFFLGDLNGFPQLVVANLATKTTDVRPIPTAGMYLFFEYDLVSGRVIAATTAAGIPIVSINPSTGEVTTLLTTGFVGGVRFQVSAFDIARRRLFFLGDSAGVPQLIAVDLGSSIVKVTPIPTDGIYMFFEFALILNEIPAMSPILLCAMAIVLAGTAVVVQTRTRC